MVPVWLTLNMGSKAIDTPSAELQAPAVKVVDVTEYVIMAK